MTHGQMSLHGSQGLSISSEKLAPSFLKSGSWVSSSLMYRVETQLNFGLGICFGHQIVSRALGGTVDGTRELPWEIGPTTIYSTYMGKILYGKERLVNMSSLVY